MQCSRATLEFYKYTAGAFVFWLEAQGLTSPDEVSARHVRQHLAGLTGADTTIHDHARAIRTLLRFWHAEGYAPALIIFAMPKVAKKRLLCLTSEELRRVIEACTTPRDRALILFMADTGLRRAEVAALNWGDIDFASGLVRVRLGKGRKDRSAVVGATARRALLAYRRQVANPAEGRALFQARGGTRLTGTGLLLIFRRLSKRAGIHVTPHALRRTFVILALRGGMGTLHLQALLGHASLDMVQHYARMVDDDLLQAHRAHSPIDRLVK